MVKIAFKFSKNPFTQREEASVSPASEEAARGLRYLAEPRTFDDSIKTAISRAATRAGLTYSRAFTFWYGTARRVDADELEAIKKAAVAKQREDEGEFVRLVNDFIQLAEQVATLAPDQARKHAAEMQRVAREARILVGERFGCQPNTTGLT